MSNPLPKLTTLPSAARSRTMAAVKSKDTTPEMRVRRIVHKLGRRYRLHVKNLPGKPDLVFRRFKKAIFVHGCFWHDHDCKRGARAPKTNVDYWNAKIAGNRARDLANLDALTGAGWDVLTVWECEMKDADGLTARLAEFLNVEPKS